MIIDNDQEDLELDELQQLASQLMDAPTEAGCASNERLKVHSDDFDILPMPGDGEP
jgi:hypothetical protein